ncbi:dihydroxyacetone kinase phosphoryl donor subunit DhaM [Cellulosimicrobium marinum]|uniref:dihydroxyacetone kinase phosphoryl donor subunit DhaM n=1 Tax=Cellulosimicrobium marinum TaxID=1638992 RepID=UPI001E518D8D|nr:dihydroxyacetone kinase phosphoryl donor subunit DhaM [Cellulosimicrobium marinum]MCB7137664.1 PTS-dependent dihydroxyacetone kinase phosphotransferase subunit DhaM [Cellulosimicrobium marinum]
MTVQDGPHDVPVARARTALVLVSHSRGLAEGAVELAAQMAPGVVLLAAGGTDDGGLGTSYDRVQAAVEESLGLAEGTVVLADLGSAVMTVETVLDMEDLDGRVVLADAPFVEGAVAAAVTAHGGGSLAEVVASAEHAGGTFAVGPGSAAAPEEPGGTAGVPGPGAAADDGLASARVTLRNRLGLHARPAAVLARLVAGYDASVTVDGVNGASVLELMKLGAAGGAELDVRAQGPQAQEVLAAVVEAVEGGFGET